MYSTVYDIQISRKKWLKLSSNGESLSMRRSRQSTRMMDWAAYLLAYSVLGRVRSGLISIKPGRVSVLFMESVSPQLLSSPM